MDEKLLEKAKNISRLYANIQRCMNSIEYHNRRIAHVKDQYEKGNGPWVFGLKTFSNSKKGRDYIICRSKACIDNANKSIEKYEKELSVLLNKKS